MMLHRRMCLDDPREVEEALDETVCANGTCSGLTVRGSYYVSINRGGEGGSWRRETGQEIYSPLVMAFTHENKEKWKASTSVKGYAMDPLYTPSLQTLLSSLEELDPGNVLLRLAHLYEAGEDHDYSSIAKVELRKLFSGRIIKEVKEMSLVANQEKAKMKWKVVGETEETSAAPPKGGPLNKSALVVELLPWRFVHFCFDFLRNLSANLKEES